MSTTYDSVPYPTVPRHHTHPAHLHAVARMFRVAAPPVESARVLEIGCGDATHLIACAAAMPNATFLGIDLSQEAIQRGIQLIGRVGLTNIQLRAQDILAWEPPAHSFEYVIADGVYSWIPERVRNAMMALIGRVLVPNGIAYFSFNVYPGGYPRRMLWEMMKFHVQAIEDPNAKIDEARRMADFMRAARPAVEGQERGLFDSDVDLVYNERNRNIFYHDELSDTNDPVYIHQFIDHAREHGMKFVAECVPQTMSNLPFQPDVVAKLDALTREDPERREQFYDYATLKRFRQSLFTTADHTVCGTPDPAAIPSLLLMSNATPDGADLRPNVPMTFRIEKDTATFDGEVIKAALVVLTEHQPRRFTYAELLTLTRRKIGRDQITDAEESELLAGLTAAWLTGLILLKGHRPMYRDDVSERPTICPLARAQVESGALGTSLLHSSSRFDDPISQRLVQLLDGTRTIDEIGSVLYAAFPPDKRPPEAQFQSGLRQNLTMLARNGYLVG